MGARGPWWGEATWPPGGEKPCGPPVGRSRVATAGKGPEKGRPAWRPRWGRAHCPFHFFASPAWEASISALLSSGRLSSVALQILCQWPMRPAGASLSRKSEDGKGDRTERRFRHPSGHMSATSFTPSRDDISLSGASPTISLHRAPAGTVSSSCTFRPSPQHGQCFRKVFQVNERNERNVCNQRLPGAPNMNSFPP